MNGRRVIAIHRDPAAVARNHLTREERELLDDALAQHAATSPEFVAMVNDALARHGLLRVEEGTEGTTPGRPWALVAGKPNESPRKGL